MWMQPTLPTFNINTCTEKQQKFLCEFVEIKRNGWMHYTRAYNELTYNFWKPLTDQQDAFVNDLAENMKSFIKAKHVGRN